MSAYIIRRLLLMIPTLFGILLLNFLIVQAAPGGPVEQIIIQLSDPSASATNRIAGPKSDFAGGATQQPGAAGAQTYRGARGLDPDLIADLERQFGFDKPAHERFYKMMVDYLHFDFGTSFFRDEPVTDLILDKLPVSISLGLWTTLLVYLISIPLGIAKAVRDGSHFDIWTSTAIVIGQAIPGFLFAILLIILFAGGSYFQWFPLRGLVSDNWEELSLWGKIIDYFWHLTLPILAMVISGFASLTLLTKNSFIEEIGKQYVTTARAKGLSEKRVLYGHVFRNAMLIVISGLPSALLSILFTSALLIEVIFSLDGLGLLGFEAAINRDYPVMFGTLFIFTLIGLVFKLLGDITYMLIDPRIDFERRSV
ncbi:MAG: microcin ABC transporter permease [Rickettsiales bacterium]|nr:microcin ABC transporter permease [Rickettsiales bacterium]